MCCSLVVLRSQTVFALDVAQIKPAATLLHLHSAKSLQAVLRIFSTTTFFRHYRLLSETAHVFPKTPSPTPLGASKPMSRCYPNGEITQDSTSSRVSNDLYESLDDLFLFLATALPFLDGLVASSCSCKELLFLVLSPCSFLTWDFDITNDNPIKDFREEEEADSDEEAVVASRKRAPGTIPKSLSINRCKTTTHTDVDILSIYIADNEIVRMPVMAVVSDVLTVGDSDTVFYRPADGPLERLVWRPLSVQEEFSRLLDLCGDGVVVKVVPANDEEFHSEDEGREKVVELPVNSKTWNQKQNDNPVLPLITPDGPQPAAAQGKGKRKGKEKAVDNAVVEKRPRGRPRKDVTPASNPLPSTRAGRATRLSEKASEAAASKAAKQQDDKIADIRRDIRNKKASFRIDE
ncbi:hypothetical protein BZA77DRAFT_290708 [Pyronema omphalodes]|nr:hypothetical protein BZA77DRAFT_290708 [Pyronema omphalodes]